MPHEPSPPLSVVIVLFFLLPEEAEPTVRLHVDLALVQHKALRDGGLHLRHGTGGGGLDVSGGAVDAVHDEGTAVHAGLGGADEVLVEGATSPGGIYVCIGVEDGFEVFPFAGVAGRFPLSVPHAFRGTVHSVDQDNTMHKKERKINPTDTSATPQPALSVCTSNAR